MHCKTPLLAARHLLLAVLVDGVSTYAANWPRASTQDRLAVEQLPSTTQATQELQNGLGKLMRICTYGSGSLATTQRQAFELWTAQSVQAQSDLRTVQQEVNETSRQFVQNSRISKNQICQYIPTLTPLNWACEGFQQDSQALQKATSQAQKMINEAHQRMALYEKFAKLEDQGCVRPGFTMRLWETEQNHLWPSVMRVTPTMKSSLPYAKPD